MNDYTDKLFWISWYQPTQDYRPLNDPLNENTLYWGCTGMRCDDEHSTIVAMVIAYDEDSAKDVIKKDWPEAEEWRFCNVKKNTALSDRFPLQGWSKERIEEFNRATQ